MKLTRVIEFSCLTDTQSTRTDDTNFLDIRSFEFWEYSLRQPPCEIRSGRSSIFGLNVFELGRDIDEIFCVFDFGSTSEVEGKELFGSGREGSKGSLRSDRGAKARGESSEHDGLKREKREIRGEG